MTCSASVVRRVGCGLNAFRFFLGCVVCVFCTENIFIDTSLTRYKVVSSTIGVLGSTGTIRGAGGLTDMASAKLVGADAVRTWDVTNLDSTLAEAESMDLRVSAGIWMTHAASAYGNCVDMEADTFWKNELDRFLHAVHVGKDSPALLWWTVGNEIELEISWEAGSECLWRRLEWVVRAIKAEDPNHPAGPVLNGLHEKKVSSVVRLCPSCDFLGVNAYGEESLHVGDRLESYGWLKAFSITEYGPTGHWLTDLTPWDTYTEETSAVKSARYNDTCNYCEQHDKCIGSFAFYWGWKWEKTGTWYGLENQWADVTTGVGADCPDCESEVVDTLRQCWSGVPSTLEDHPPTMQAVEVDGSVLSSTVFRAKSDSLVKLKALATHPSNAPLTAVWGVTIDSYSASIGGAYENSLPLLSGLWPDSLGSPTGLGMDVLFNTSALQLEHSYRLYVFVRPSQYRSQGFLHPRRGKEASASLAFRLCHDAQVGELCQQQVQAAMQFGVSKRPQAFEGVNSTSSFGEFQMLLYQKGNSDCPMPCSAPESWCHTSIAGEDCYSDVQWAKQQGVRQYPERYQGLGSWSSFEDFQFSLYKMGQGQCPRPCVKRQGWILR